MRRAWIVAVCIMFSGLKPATPQVLQEKIVVERILVDARVTGYTGEPILGLTSADFRVRIDGKPATVESVEWIPESAAARELAGIDAPLPEVNKTMDVPAPQGRLLIFFFQTDFARHYSRVAGQMEILQKIDQLLEWLEPEDRVAVLSFDSHLKFRLDFSDDKHRIEGAMRDALLTNEPNTPPIVPMPSLRARLDPQAMKDAPTSEHALLLIGNALRPIPGPKSLVLFGWGLGRFGSGGVRMLPIYAAAKQALEAARVSVFSLDFTQADYHSLEVGLGKVSDDTGGFYAKTFRFPALAIDRLQRTLTGHYELEVRKPETKVRGVHSIEVDVARRNSLVMARSTYVDAD